MTKRVVPGVTPEYAARLKDLQAANRQIGYSAEEQLAWLTDFIDEDRAKWQSATRAAHGDCLLAFCHGYPENLLQDDALPSRLDAETVDALHDELGHVLRRLVTASPGEPVPMPGDPAPVVLLRASGRGERPAAWGRQVKRRDVRSELFDRLQSAVLSPAGERLISCPACMRPFMAFHKQMFCSTKCAQKARNDRRLALGLERRAKEKPRGKSTRKR